MRIGTNQIWLFSVESYFNKGLIKGLDKDDQKEGLFKRIKNIEDKNKHLLKASSVANKGKAAKNESGYNYDSQYAFYRFYRDFKNLTLTSLKYLQNQNQK